MASEDTMRLSLLRLLVSWWLIPAAWVMVWPICWLLAGAEDATDAAKVLTRAAWHGVA